MSELLDEVYEGLRTSEAVQSSVNRQMEALFTGLQDLRRASDQEWRATIAACRSHPIHEIILQDPFTHRAFTKPRGYAGDAVMLDYIYGREEGWPEPETTPLGAAIFKYTTDAPAAAGVRARRRFIARLIDELATVSDEPEVFSVASGHLREAGLAQAVKQNRLKRLVAMDADSASLQEVDRLYAPYRVASLRADLRRLLANRLPTGSFDLVYSTGLFDYLSPSIGQRLVRTMFQMLKPAGRLIVANFMPGIRDVGYMEAFMDWNLIYRTRYDMLQLTEHVPQPEIKDIRIFAEENQNILFLEVTRA